MPAPVTIVRPTFTNSDTPDATEFNNVTAASATVPDAAAGSEGVIRLAGDLTGTAAAPALATSGVVAGQYGESGANVAVVTVDAKGRVTTATERALTAADIGAQAAGALGFTNKLINGNFDVWQRGTGSTSCPAGTRTFLADRWAVLAAGAAPTQQRSTTTPNFRSRYSLLLTGATSVTTVDVAQRIEAQTVGTGLRTTVTFSAQVQNNSGAAFTPTLIVRTPSAEDNWTTKTDRVTQVLQSCADSAWTQVSHTFDASVLTDIANGMEVCLQIPSGSLVAGDTVRISQMQLCEGAAVNTFEAVPYPLVLAQCLYFYEVVAFGPNNPLGVGVCGVANSAQVSMVFRTSYKRGGGVSASIDSIANVRIATDVGGAFASVSTPSNAIIAGTRLDNCRITFDGNAGLTAGRAYQCAAVGSVNIILDAELA